MRVSLPCLFWRQFKWATALLVHLLLLAQTNKAEQKVAISFTAFLSMYYLINTEFIFGLFHNTLSLSAHHYNIVKCQNAKGKRTVVERKEGLASILGNIN